MAADVVVSATVVVTSVVVGSAVVVSVLKSVVAETADGVSTVVGESDVSADEADVVVKDTYVSVEETYVSVEDSTTVEEVAPSSLVVGAKGVKTEVSVEASEVAVVDMVATEVAAEVVVAETTSFQYSINYTPIKKYSRGLQGLATAEPMANRPNATRK